MRSRLLLASLVLSVVPVGSVAAEDDHHDHAHHAHHDYGSTTGEAHVHGEVILQLALQGKDLIVNLRSPAMNLVGFEQPANTTEHVQQVEAAESKLRQVAGWLMLRGGECRMAEVETNFGSLLPPTEPVLDHGTHADVGLNAQFLCDQPAKLQALTATLFRDFPGVDKVTVQWVLDAGAGEHVLTSDKPDLRFNK